jgi:hypothetical protein
MKGNKTGNEFAQECMSKNWDIEVMEVVICTVVSRYGGRCGGRRRSRKYNLRSQRANIHGELTALVSEVVQGPNSELP